MSDIANSVSTRSAPRLDGETRAQRRWLVIGIPAIILVAGGAWLATHGRAAGKPQPAGAASRGAGAPVPVVVAKAEKRDLPVYLTGLGTVTAYNTVTVKTRVDGPIVQIAFTEGQEVKKGDLLAVVDPRPFEVQLTQAKGTLAKDQAQLQDARINLQRNEDLFKQGILAEQQRDTQAALVKQLEASAQVDQAQIANDTLQLSFTRITSPVSGRAGLRLVDVGNIVHATDQNGIVVITELEPITAVFALPEDALPTVAEHMKNGPLTLEAWSRDDRTKIATGRLLTVDNQIDPSTGTGKLKGIFDNKDRALWPNQFVNAHLLIEVRKDQTVVPAAAVQRGSTGVFSYVVKPDNTVEVRQVKVALNQAGLTAIAEGLAPGEQVVTDGHEKVQAGSKVEIRTAGEGGTAPPAASPAS
jgi:membrane fusion protein, multidrug efflux system